MQKKKILIFIDWYLPGYKAGGPIQSIANLVNHLDDELDISIVTSNKDLGMNTPYADLTFNTWLNRDNYRVIYLDEANQNSNMYRKLLTEHHYNAIYLNSLFSVRFTLLPLWAAIKLKSEIVLAPRGMLGEGALNIKKIKKQLFLALFKFLKIAKRVTWHATAETESEEIKQHFGNDVKISIAPNLSSNTKNKKFKK